MSFIKRLCLFTDFDETAFDREAPEDTQKFEAFLGKIEASGLPVSLCYNTARVYNSLRDKIDLYNFRHPHWALCSGGSEIIDGATRQPFGAWEEEQHKTRADWSVDKIRKAAEGFFLKHQLQAELEAERHQTHLNLSFRAQGLSAAQLAAIESEFMTSNLATAITYHDNQFLGFKPPGHHKGAIMDWFCQRQQIGVEGNCVVYAGDGSNDLPGFRANCVDCGIVVGNKPELVEPLRASGHYDADLHVSERLGPLALIEGVQRVLVKNGRARIQI